MATPLSFHPHPWILSLHLVFVVTWFAGLFYLPRLFVYHSLTSDEIGHERFLVMERKLFFGIMTPSAILTVLFGVWLWLSAWPLLLWLEIKLALVALLLAYHVYCGKLYIDFKRRQNRHSHVFYRWLNELPVVLLLAIVLLAVLKPV